jgi:hypothetical protein
MFWADLKNCLILIISLQILPAFHCDIYERMKKMDLKEGFSTFFVLRPLKNILNPRDIFFCRFLKTEKKLKKIIFLSQSPKVYDRMRFCMAN